MHSRKHASCRAAAHRRQKCQCTGKDTKMSPGLALANRKQQSRTAIAGFFSPPPHSSCTFNIHRAYHPQDSHSHKPSLSHILTSSATWPLQLVSRLHDASRSSATELPTRHTRFPSIQPSTAETSCRLLPGDDWSSATVTKDHRLACTNDHLLQDEKCRLLPTCKGSLHLLQGTMDIHNADTSSST